MRNEKRRRKTMDYYDLLEKPVYRSIINLTEKFQYKQNGLRLIHYRWALIKNHDNIETKNPYDAFQMNRFFSACYTKEAWDGIVKESKKNQEKTEKLIGRKLEPSWKNRTYQKIYNSLYTNYGLDYLYKTRSIEKNCVEGKQATNNLSGYLNKLVYKYEILEKVKRESDKYPRYIINDHSNVFIARDAKAIKQYVDILVMKKEHAKILELYKLITNMIEPNIKNLLDDINKK